MLIRCSNMYMMLRCCNMLFKHDKRFMMSKMYVLMYVCKDVKNVTFFKNLDFRVGTPFWGSKNHFFENLAKNLIFYVLGPKNLIFRVRTTFLGPKTQKIHFFQKTSILGPKWGDAERRGYNPLRPSSMTPVN